MNTPVTLEIEKLLIEKDIDMPVSPTIADVVMWLYKKHSIWICIDKAEGFDWWKFNIRMLKDVGYVYGGFGSDFNSPIEAYSQAVEYVLKNLI